MHLTRAALLVALFVPLFAAAGCKTKNPNYCPDDPDMLCDEARPDSGGEACSASDPCAVGVCKEPPGECVQCLADADCTAAATPACNLTTNTCEPCSAHAQCASEVCLPNGECAQETAVAYVDANGDDNNACDRGAACKTVTRALVTGKRILKIAGRIDDPVVFDNTPTTTVFAESTAKLTRSGGGMIMEVKGTSNVTIHGLEISEAIGGAGGIGISLTSGAPTLTLIQTRVINNSGRGIVANAGTLVLHRSTIAENEGGGLDVSAAQKVEIVNNFIVNNGKSAGSGLSLVGGASIGTITDAAGSRFAFNTIALNGNGGGSPFPAGVSCATADLEAGGNIIYANTRGTMNDVSVQSGGTCTYGNTFVSGPVAGDLGFNISADPARYHLVATSPASVLDVGGTCPAHDFDGEMRPMNGACDLGADELKVP